MACSFLGGSSGSKLMSPALSVPRVWVMTCRRLDSTEVQVVHEQRILLSSHVECALPPLRCCQLLLAEVPEVPRPTVTAVQPHEPGNGCLAHHVGCGVVDAVGRGHNHALLVLLHAGHHCRTEWWG